MFWFFVFIVIGVAVGIFLGKGGAPVDTHEEAGFNEDDGDGGVTDIGDSNYSTYHFLEEE